MAVSDVLEKLQKPIFRVTNLQRELVDCYSVLFGGFALGVLTAALIWF